MTFLKKAIRKKTFGKNFILNFFFFDQIKKSVFFLLKKLRPNNIWLKSYDHIKSEYYV